MVEKRIKDLNTKLNEANRERKSVEVALVGAKKQAKDQHQQLRRAEDQLVMDKKKLRRKN